MPLTTAPFDGPTDRPHAYILHENDEWVEPLRHALDGEGIPYREWFVAEGSFDFSKAPPPGIFYNRMSASSHTRPGLMSSEGTMTRGQSQASSPMLLSWVGRDWRHQGDTKEHGEFHHGTDRTSP